MSDRNGSWAGLDPGRSKCGLVRCDDEQRQIIEAWIEPTGRCLETLQSWRAQGLRGVVLGDGTGSGGWIAPLQNLGLTVNLVNEHGSTLAARQRYWQLRPGRGWRQLLPKGMRLPPRAIDDVVAQLLLERWLERPLMRPMELEAPLQERERQARAAQKRARTVKS